ncbi:MAG: hypothetical protein KF855_10540 [Acidobacteria bacterium]|nr:hypothetical protein [Acidobacteriota bacterium]
MDQNFEHAFVMESFGVRIRIESNDEELLTDAAENLRWAFAEKMEISDDDGDVALSFGLEKSGKEFILYRDGEYFSKGEIKKIFLKYMNSVVRNRVAEFAPDHTFIHAGSVGWKGRSFIFPAKSFKGKSTLVSELVKLGADYYSDEYAVIDDNGLNHPFPRPLSLRTGEGKDLREDEVPVAEINGIAGTEPIPIGMVVLTEFDPESAEQLRRLTTGEGILETLVHTIPFARDPETSLKRLKSSLNRAIILKGIRGDAKDFALTVLSNIDNNLDSELISESFFGGDNE